MNGMEGIFGIIGIGAGLYSLYAWFQLKSGRTEGVVQQKK